MSRLNPADLARQAAGLTADALPDHHVLECRVRPNGYVVITLTWQAFEDRFQQFTEKTVIHDLIRQAFGQGVWWQASRPVERAA